MKSLLAMSLGLVVVSGLLTTGGCVSKEDYDKLWAMNRQVNEELEKTQGKLRALEARNRELQGMLDSRDQTIDSLNKQLAILKTENDALRADLDKLKNQKVEIPKPPTLGPLPRGLNEALRKLAAAHPDLFDFDETHGMIKLKADLTFDSGKDIVKPAAAAALKKLADVLDSPEALPFNVYVAGHTDDQPIRAAVEHKTNWGLSSHRAIAVLNVLFGAGVDLTRMGAMGFSMHHPVVANAPGHKGAEGNRRVEIWIVPKGLLLTEAAPGVKGENVPDKPATSTDDEK